MYEGYSGSKQRQYGSKSLIFGKYQNITTLQHFALKKNIPHINAANGVQKIQQTFLGGKQTSISTANSYVILCRNCQGKKFFKIQSRNFCDKTFCDMGDDTDYISLNLPPNLKLWRLMFFIWPDFLFHSKFKTEIFLFKFCKMSYSTTKLSRQKLKDFDVLHNFVSNILGPFTNFCGGSPRNHIC